MLSASFAKNVLANPLRIAWLCPSCLADLTCAALPSSPARLILRRASSNAAQKRDRRLPPFPARTRFAPSPTGYMHIGGLRTALFSYLLAKATGGKFILRIEDTDKKRFVPGAIEKLCHDLQWAGLQWDEGPVVGGDFGPYQQSHRTEIYQRHAEHLLNTGSAYRCFCVPQTEGAGSQTYVTSGCHQNCASLPTDEAASRSSSEAYTIRLSPSPDITTRTYPDLVYGNIKRLKRTSGTAIAAGGDDDAADLSDTILIKTDGTPTYHFANVVDDHLMQITHVIRGTEWMASTPLHYDLYQAFGWQPPVYAHVGLLLDQNKAKLSKRNADLSLDVESLRTDHDVLPEALCNFLALQGWNNPQSSDIMNMQDLVLNFDLKFTKGNTVVSTEKLWFLQRSHIDERCRLAKQQGTDMPLRPLIDQLVKTVQESYPNLQPTNGLSLDTLCAVLILIDGKSFRSARQFVRRNAYIFDFNHAETDALSNPNDEMSALIAKLFLSDDLIDAARLPRTESSVAQYDELHEAHLRINKVLASLLWSYVLDSQSSVDVIQALVDREHDSQIATTLSISPEDSSALLKRYRSIQKMLMRRLRDALCGGLPGPSISYVIALIGVDACRARLKHG